MAVYKIRDAAGETIPYIADWSEDGALNAVTQFAQLIESLAHCVGAALSAAGDTRDPARPLSGLARKVSRTHGGADTLALPESRRKVSTSADD